MAAATSNNATNLVWGIDIGGANLKLANVSGESSATAFPLWIEFESLHIRLQTLLDEFVQQTGERAEFLAVTMTGEMADCYEDRDAGVSQILDQVALAFPPDRTLVYGINQNHTGGDWLDPNSARQQAWSVAASNWHALASWVIRGGLDEMLTSSVRQIDDHSLRLASVDLLCDFGSTTTDVIPIADGTLATIAKTDRQRLQLGQLIYTGIGRTPVAAILHTVQLGGQDCPIVAETFATSDDAYLVLGLTSEDADDCATSDGRPRTLPCGRQRLARMIAEDASRLSMSQIEQLAEQVVTAQAERIAAAIRSNLPAGFGPWRALIVGHGRALAERVQSLMSETLTMLWLDDLISPSASRAAPAVAVAWLLEQHFASARTTDT